MRFVKETVVPASVAAVFAFHERADAFSLLQPPWERSEIVQPPKGLEVGTVVKLRTRVGPMWFDIEAEHVAYEKNALFEDVMRKGPFARWHHRHVFLPDPGGCRLRDEIDYALPLGPLGRLVAPLVVQDRLQRLFDYRHEVTRREVLNAVEPELVPAPPPGAHA